MLAFLAAACRRLIAGVNAIYSAPRYVRHNEAALYLLGTYDMNL